MSQERNRGRHKRPISGDGRSPKTDTLDDHFDPVKQRERTYASNCDVSDVGAASEQSRFKRPYVALMTGSFLDLSNHNLAADPQSSKRTRTDIAGASNQYLPERLTRLEKRVSFVQDAQSKDGSHASRANLVLYQVTQPRDETEDHCAQQSRT